VGAARRWATGARRWLLLASALLCNVVSASEKVSVQLPGRHQFQFAGHYIAKARGYYDDAGLDVELRAGGPGAAPPIDAVANLRADFGVGSSAVAAARMNGQRLVALAAILQQSSAVWLVRDGLATGDVGNLAGARLRTLPDREVPPDLIAPFVRAGVEAQRLAIVPTVHAVEEFARGRVDLLAASQDNEPFELRARGVEFGVIDPREHGFDFYGEVLFTSADLAIRRPEMVARFRDATLRGWLAALADVDAAAHLIHVHYAPERTFEQLVSEGQRLRQLAAYGKVEMGHMSVQRWSAIGEQLRELGLGRERLDARSFVHADHGPAVKVGFDPLRVSLLTLLATLVLGGLKLLFDNRAMSRELARLTRREADLEAGELRFQFLMDVAPMPIVIFALEDSRVIYANDRALRWMGIEAIGDDTRVSTWLPQFAAGAPALRQLVDRRGLRDVEFEHPANARDGTSRWTLLTARVIEFEDKACAFASINDISARKNAELELAMLSAQRGKVLADIEQLQARLRDQARRDGLTGLYNRRQLDAALPRALADCRRNALPISMLVVDADHFKHVNDRHGHAIGDEVLRSLAALLTNCHRETDMVFRFGGEEFVVLMPGAARHVAIERAEALRATIEQSPLSRAAADLRLTVSIGVACEEGGGEMRDDLFKRADAAVYEAKRGGRNRVVVERTAEEPAIGGAA